MNIVTDQVHLKRHLNTLCLIGRLPTEILEDIFLCYLWADIDPKLNAKSFTNLGESDVDDLLKTLASVCSRWLATVIRCPSLWNIVCNPENYPAGPNLAKSGTGPLYITGNSEAIYGIPDILEHASRIKELYWEHDVDYYGEFDTTLIQRALAGPSSRLTEVVLYIQLGLDHPVCLPWDLFAGAQSVLRLYVLGCWFERNEMCFPPRLRTLSLQFFILSGGSLDIRPLLATLAEQCPELEQLRIDGDRGALVATPDDVSRVCFPRLRQIALSAENINVLQLLERIERPVCEQTVARMYFRQPDMQFDAAQALDQNLARATTLFVLSQHTDHCLVGKTGGMRWTGTRHEVCDTRLQIAYDLPWLGALDAKDIVFDLQMTSLRSGADEETWEALLDCVPRLEALVMRDDYICIHCGSRSLFAALGDTTSHVLIPRLKRLELVIGRVFAKGLAKEWEKELGACVTARKAAAEAGSEELHSITVSWTVSQEHSKGVIEEELKTLVGDVEVYCIEGGIYDEVDR